jgi:2-polyprenyl-3-methyl-5-hydroxy-6-metoxy-1,4-benzoquinol methylase
MTCTCSPTAGFTARHFDDKRARAELRTYHRNGPGPTTQRLLNGLRAVGATHGALLDIGAGVGVLTFELLKAGVDQALCVDLSPASLAVGREEAERQGCAGRIASREADLGAVAAELAPPDVVTLDRVVCCYPVYSALLEAAARHARQFLALSYPRSRWFVRKALWAENVVRQVQGDPFRAFVHSPAAMAILLRQRGFVRVYRESTIGWHADIYARDAA